MADPRALDALRRIENALARIEAAADRPEPVQGPSPELEQVREAHDRLRERVTGAVSQLDRLIAAGEPG